MTNEELALDIISNNRKLRLQTPPIRGLIRDAMMSIANLKDEQLKEILNDNEFETYINSIFPYQEDTKGMICSARKKEWRKCFEYIKSKVFN